MKYKIKRKRVIIILILTSIVIWFIDSLTDFLFFYNVKFLDILILNVSLYEIYTRVLIISIFILAFLLLDYKVRQERNRYFTLSDTMKDIILTYTLDGKITYANKKALEFFDLSLDEIRDKKVEEVVDFVDKDKFNRGKQIRLNGYTEILQDIIKVKKNKKMHYFDIYTIPLECNEKAKELLLRGRDITRFEKTYRNLEKNKKELSTVLNSIGDGVIALDKGGKITRVNTKACSMIGLKRDEIMGKKLNKILDLNTIGSSEEVEGRIKKVIINGKKLSENTTLVIASQNGKKYFVEDNISSIVDNKGNINGAVMVLRDITEEKELKYVQKLLMTGIEQLQEKIIITDKNGTIEYVNKAFLQDTGYNKSEIIGERIDIIQSGLHDEKFYRDIRGTILNGNVWEGEIINKKKNGTFYNDSVFISPIYADKNSENITNFLCIQKNITKEKEMEKNMRQSQKLESLGTLANGIANDFNNILNSIKTNIQMLNKIGKLKQNKGKKYLKDIRNAISRAEDLINQILTFTHETKKEIKIIDVADIVNDIVDLFENVLPSNIQIKKDIKKAKKIYADQTQIYQVFMNLCTNAYHAMEEKGGKLTIRLSDEEISSTDEVDLKPGKYVKIIVEDTGKGIPIKYKDKIFEPYFTTKSEKKGSGLGLAVVYGIVEEYDGAIELKSEINMGTRVKILLPAKQGKEERVEENEEKVDLREKVESENYRISYNEKSGYIMYVDDEVSLLDLIKERLDMEGYKVNTFKNPVKALDDFKENHGRYNLIITDYAMAQKNGLKLSKDMLKIFPEIPIIILTGYIAELNKSNLMEYGIKDLIYKPVDFSHLIEIIEKYKL